MITINYLALSEGQAILNRETDTALYDGVLLKKHEVEAHDEASALLYDTANGHIFVDKNGKQDFTDEFIKEVKGAYYD